MHNYRRLVLSDTHLGAFQSDPAAMLYILCHPDYRADETLILGDFLDDSGLSRAQSRQHPLFEPIANSIRLRSGKTCILAGDHDQVIMNTAFRHNLEDCLNAHVQSHYSEQNHDGGHIVAIHGHQFEKQGKHRAVHWLYGKLEPLLTGLSATGECHRQDRLTQRFNMASHKLHQALACVVSHVTGFQKKMHDFAQTNGVDILLTGHIHYPFVKKDSRNRIFANAGNYRSALAETHDGRWHIIALPRVRRKQAYSLYKDFMCYKNVPPSRDTGFTHLLQDIWGHSPLPVCNRRARGFPDRSP